MAQDQTLFIFLLVIGIVVVVWWLSNGNEKFYGGVGRCLDSCQEVARKCGQTGRSYEQCNVATSMCEALCYEWAS